MYLGKIARYRENIVRIVPNERMVTCNDDPHMDFLSGGEKLYVVLIWFHHGDRLVNLNVSWFVSKGLRNELEMNDKYWSSLLNRIMTQF